MKKILLSGMLLSFLFVGCEKQNIEPTTIITKSKDSDTDDKTKTPNSKTIVMVEWDDWGRKKKECNGWGLCNANWFPKSEIGNYSSNLEYDAVLGSYYTDILLPENLYPIEEEYEVFYVDEDIILTTSEEPSVGTDLTIPEGEYEYDVNIGTYGGYKIYLNQ